MRALNILSGGAAQGLVEAVAPTFAARSGWRIDGDYDAVGTVAVKLRAGAAADLVILTEPILDALGREGHLAAGSPTPIGRVETALAVRAGDPIVKIADADALRTVFLAADALFVPDMTSSTAGRHVATVLDRLGIAADMQARLQESPNGATAMRRLSESGFARPLGCTQSTEIIRTPRLFLLGALPSPCGLSTLYSAAVTRRAANGPAARLLIDLLVSPDHAGLRENAGFLPAA